MGSSQWKSLVQRGTRRDVPVARLPLNVAPARKPKRPADLIDLRPNKTKKQTPKTLLPSEDALFTFQKASPLYAPTCQSLMYIV